MDAKGRLLGATYSFPNKEAPTAYGAYRPLVKLRLPLEDTWHVLWAAARGKTTATRRSNDSMRFALDLLQREKEPARAARAS